MATQEKPSAPPEAVPLMDSSQQGAAPAPPPYPGPPQEGAYPAQGGAYPAQNGAYPPQGGAYPPQSGAYPPQGSAYPPQNVTYLPQGATYPPQGAEYNKAGAYPPQGGAYPPQGGAYPPHGGAYPAHGGVYPAQGYAAPTQVVVVAPPAQTNYPDHLGFSIFNLICCCFCIGIVALLKSLEVQKANQRGDAESAKRLSAEAQRLNKIGVGVGTVIILLWVGFVITINLLQFSFFWI